MDEQHESIIVGYGYAVKKWEAARKEREPDNVETIKIKRLISLGYHMERDIGISYGGS